jgi:hypothetical protein
MAAVTKVLIIAQEIQPARTALLAQEDPAAVSGARFAGHISVVDRLGPEWSFARCKALCLMVDRGLHLFWHERCCWLYDVVAIIGWCAAPGVSASGNIRVDFGDRHGRRAEWLRLAESCRAAFEAVPWKTAVNSGWTGVRAVLGTLSLR